MDFLKNDFNFFFFVLNLCEGDDQQLFLNGNNDDNKRVLDFFRIVGSVKKSLKRSYDQQNIVSSVKDSLLQTAS